MEEIEASFGGELDYLFCATSTCGTLRGCSTYLRERGRRTRVIAVDAVGSVIFGRDLEKRLLPGHGAAFRPALYEPGTEDDIVWVTDLDCVVACRLLVSLEALFMGGSSGAVLAAVNRLSRDLPGDANVAVILPDRGERYLDTIYDDAWVAAQFGDVSYNWDDIEQ
jgi:cysteine synthase A